jgi:hypothetical protein
MVDPWLAGELRLAQRQGLLVGRHISMVQANGIVILDWIERLETSRHHADDEIFRFKTALLSLGDERWTPEMLFKDYFPAPIDEDDVPDSLDVETEAGKLGVDYSEVEWKSGSEAIDEFQELMKGIGSLSTGTLSGSSFAGRSKGGWF